MKAFLWASFFAKRLHRLNFMANFAPLLTTFRAFRISCSCSQGLFQSQRLETANVSVVFSQKGSVRCSETAFLRIFRDVTLSIVVLSNPYHKVADQHMSFPDHKEDIVLASATVFNC